MKALLTFTLLSAFLLHSSLCDLNFKNLDMKFKGFDLPTMTDEKHGYINDQPKGQIPHKIYWNLWPAKEVDPDKAPLLVWVMGGPGVGGNAATFNFAGPFHLDDETRIFGVNKWGLNKITNMLIIDFPFGVGYSGSESPLWLDPHPDQIPHTFNRVIRKWFKANSQYASHDLYLGGDSATGQVMPTFYQKAKEDSENNKWLKQLRGFLFDAPYFTIRYWSEGAIMKGMMYHNIDKKKIPAYLKFVKNTIKKKPHNYAEGYFRYFDAHMQKYNRYSPKGIDYFNIRKFTLYNRNIPKYCPYSKKPIFHS